MKNWKMPFPKRNPTLTSGTCEPYLTLHKKGLHRCDYIKDPEMG
jgi:hypothetical protein